MSSSGPEPRRSAAGAPSATLEAPPRRRRPRPALEPGAAAREAKPAPADEPAGAEQPSRLPPALRLLNIGYGNLVLAARVVAIVSPQSSPMRRLREEASARGKLVDATQGRRTRSILVTDSDHVILSAIHPETIAARLAAEDDGDGA